MTAVKLNNHNRFTPLQKNSASSSATVAKNALLGNSRAGSSQLGPKVPTFRGPTSAEATKVRSLHEMQGIPVLNLSEEEEINSQDGWVLRRNGKDQPVMEPIAEEDELVELLQFTSEDIQPEVEFWKNSVFCYVLGANPPWKLIEDYVYDVWGDFGVDRVSFLDNGIFLVRFTKQGSRDALLKSGYYLFDNKPIVIKPLEVSSELEKGKVDVVPVWIRLAGIPLKFWGRCLPKIAGLVGNFVQLDEPTVDKVQLSYARDLVKLKMDQRLPDVVKFLDEHGKVVNVSVSYEWKPITCTSCKGIGHLATQCRKPGPKKGKKQGLGSVPKSKHVPQQVWKPIQKAHTSVQSPTILTPEAFPPLGQVKMTPVVKSTPAKQIMRINRQGGLAGVRLSGKFSPYTFADVLVNKATPRGGVVESGKDPPSQTDGRKFYLTMIYASNDLHERVELWDFLKQVATNCTDPWLWLGDFNTVLSPVERLGGNTTEIETEQFQECVSLCCMDDISATGALYTWSNKQAASDRVYSRLDRAMGNLEWMAMYGDYIAHFHPEGLFDHCPCTVRLNTACFSDIENTTTIASLALANIQQALVDNPEDVNLIQQELDLVKDLKELTVARDSFLSQKAKIQWSIEGDLNTAYFHHAIKKRTMMNKVFQIEDKDGRLCTEGDDIQMAFLDYYQVLLGSHTQTLPVQQHVVAGGPCCTEEHWLILAQPVTIEEVKQCIFSIPNGKSPGPDGYSSQFYKDTWDIIGDEVGAAVINFFEAGRLLTQVNSTVITLIPKIDRPTSVKHFRPISCCNVLYKAISKVMCNRLARILPDIISRNQGAFVKGRSILENILICQDLVRMYNRGMVSPRCMFKLDLQKAYDSIEWQFVDQMLDALNFPEHFRKLIMLCITTPSYTPNLNGSHFGYFHGKRGLRQGDPISPLIFCICMEYLTRVMEYATRRWYFRYHPLCKSLKLTHLLFADDLLMFCKGDIKSIMLLLRALSTFSATSGLRVNAAKSEVVFNGVPNEVKMDVVQVSGFQQGVLPFKYLGVPIQPGRLSKADCHILLDKVVHKIRGIGARKLSYAGRLVLINSGTSDSLGENCCRKKEGGLNIKSVDVWNKATVGADWHSYQPPPDSNWNWRNICKVKDLLNSGFVGGHWQSDAKGYSIQSGYYWLQGPHPLVQWYNSVWAAWNIPKHSLVGWMVKHKGLQLRDKLFQLQICDSNSCVNCEQAAKTHEHLFGSYVYSSQIIDGVEHWLCRRISGSNLNCTKLQKLVVRMTLMATWYCIWKHRNECRLSLTLATPRRVIKEIQSIVKARILQKIQTVMPQRDIHV
ncbi:uncharacterized protein LOC141602008 [Silene latifolia]|uniref:uncharacterized protein LOC141602008 n=1 Tax=Silene latifolia TaxID=37657 RepID=UPI003D7704DA